MDPGCWVVGGEFEDSVFEERAERRPGSPAPYVAKRCEPQWFHEETENGDDVEVLTLKKFRGDLAYRRQDYQKALEEYSSISEKLSSTNFAVKRDVHEGQARCLARLGRHREALEIATNLENKATNTDHLTTVLYLQFAICSSLQNLEKTMFCLQKLISLHPFNPWSWGKLAESYLNLEPAFSASFPSSQTQSRFTLRDVTVTPSFTHSGKDRFSCFPEPGPESPVFPSKASGSGSQQAEIAPTNSPARTAGRGAAGCAGAQVKACASFIRARLLLQFTQSQQLSFALERNLRAQQEIEEQIQGLGLGEGALQCIAEENSEFWAT
ncbi:uncharacterized protein C8orf76 homolog isoform X2 [Perognathus longimembris pacificus]|uniref:uncharacterized protein C8orf76 homolog isoform X2 n=1 Tax=Perognathus longimembris pacificus TaxID=214514 RepID=UPI002018E70B|nr:uncharacterized protein C8orf76 homolog isoform X2 [Perognathus longimembris pacificus]